MVDTRVEQPARADDRGSGRRPARRRAALGADRRLLGQAAAGADHARAADRAIRARGLRLDFRISMGIRPNEPEWKHQVNDLIRELQPQIQAILLDYGVPLLDEQGRLITRRAARRRPRRIRRAGAGGLSDGQVPDAGAGHAGRGHGAVDGGAAAADRRAAAGPGRRPAQAAQAQGPRPGAALDRAQARAHPGLGLAAQCRLWRAVARLRRLVRDRARAS